MPKVKFLQDYTVKAEGGESYAEGQVVDLPEASANHFCIRGVAEPATEPETAKAAPKPKPAPRRSATPTTDDG